MFNIIGKTKYAYIFSLVLSVLCVASLFIWGLRLGIDFKGGTLMEVQFSGDVPSNEDVMESLKDLGLSSLSVQKKGADSHLISYAANDDKINQEVWNKISEKHPESKQLRADYRDSSISSELKKKSLWALFWASVGIMAFIAFAFRKVSRPVASWKYGLGAVIALVHDVLLTVGIFSILGHFKGVEIGVPFVAALLTILGFSVHDTIVVYDRTRENILKGNGREQFSDVVNRSLNETLIRSINTSMTVMITLLAIFFLGGEAVKDFSLALLIGIGFGTYSSIFIASALLVTSYNLQARNAK